MERIKFKPKDLSKLIRILFLKDNYKNRFLLTWNFDYLDKMISDWKDRNLSSADDVKTYLLNFKNKTKKVQELQKKTNYNNYEQRNITNFDDLYANKQ